MEHVAIAAVYFHNQLRNVYNPPFLRVGCVAATCTAL